jgi:hypothetical protein
LVPNREEGEGEGEGEGVKKIIFFSFFIYYFEID